MPRVFVKEPDFRLRARIACEEAILNKAIKCLIAYGFALGINDGEDDEDVFRGTKVSELMEHATNYDEIFLFVYRPGSEDPFGWVRFIYGNEGPDVISDYTTNLETYIKPAVDFAEAIDNGKVAIEFKEETP